MKILELLNEAFGNKLFDKIPSHQTIEDWCEKMGLDMYVNAKNEYKEQSYVSLHDESLSVGKQKLYVHMAVSADCVGRPLTLADVAIVDMAVSPSWDSKSVTSQIMKTSRQIGHPTEYSVIDNAHNLRNACTAAGVAFHRDISHTFGTFLKKHFAEDESFKSFTKTMESSRLSLHLTENAVLLPPKQRAIARFMNCFAWVEWAQRMDCIYDELNDGQKTAFSFVRENKPLVSELYAIMECVKYVETECKNKGLSLGLARCLKERIESDLINAEGVTERMQKMGHDMTEYLNEECKLLKSEDDVHIISSDVIESGFGVFKSTKSPDKLTGITKHVLVLPFSLKATSKEARMTFDFKKALENVHYADLKEWADLYLYGNPAMERREIFRKTS